MDKSNVIILREGEIFKPIIGFESKYSVSNQGRVYSHMNNMFLKLGVHNQGYLRLTLSLGKSGKHKNFYLHRLIAVHFIPNPRNVETVNHINGNKQDNRIENLEWMTNIENVQHGIDNGLIGACGENAVNSILTNTKVQWIREKVLEGEITHIEMASSLGVSSSIIMSVIKGVTWKEVYGDVIPYSKYNTIKYNTAKYGHNRVGEKVGHLTVLNRVKGNYLCQCVCGKQVVKSNFFLSENYNRSCGCMRAKAKIKTKIIKTRYEDLSGLQFGNLEVVKRVPQPIGKKKAVYYLCKDMFGTEIISRADKLKSRSH